MANSRRDGVGLGLRLSRAEHRRLQELARATGRSEAGVLRRWLQVASARDEDTLAMLRDGCITITEGVSDDVPA